MAIGLAPLILTGLSAAIGTVGTIGSAIQQSNAAKANQAMANQQASIAEQQARVQQEQIQRKGALVLGQQQAAGAASGIDSSSGSLLDVQTDTGTQMYYDSLKAQHNGDLQAWSYRSQAAQFGQQANNAMLSGGINAGASLLSGGFKTWNAGVQSGVFNGPTF